DEIWNLDRLKTELEMRSYLAQFSFFEDDVFKKTRDLSGGERGRLALAKIMYIGGNLMLLDEPTNHLDVYTREALEEALAHFTGALIVVSHDRYFIDRLAENIMVVEEGRAELYRGNYSDLVQGLKAGVVPPPAQVVSAAKDPPGKNEGDPSLRSGSGRGEQKKREKRIRRIDEE